MANEVEVKVRVTGVEQIDRALGDVRESSKNVGQTFNAMSNTIDTASNDMAKGLGTVTNSVGDLIEGADSLKTTLGLVGQTGASGLFMLLAPLAAVGTAVYGLYQGWREYTGAQREAEESAEAMAAASSDLQSKLEALAEKGVVPTGKAMRDFARATLEAQLAKERAETASKKLAKGLKRVSDARKEQKAAADALNKSIKSSTQFNAFNTQSVISNTVATDRLKAATKELTEAEKAYEKQLAEVGILSEKSGKRIKESAKQEKALEEQSEESRKAKAKELLQRYKVLQLQHLEADERTQGIKLTEQKLYTEQYAAEESADLHKKSLEQTNELIAHLQKEIKQLESLATTEAYYDKLRADARAKHNKQQADEAAKLRAQREREAARQLAEDERQAAQAEARMLKQHGLEGQLLAVKLQRARDEIEQTKLLLNERYHHEMKLAKDNETLKKIIDERYALSLEQLAQRELATLERASQERQRIRDRDQKIFEAYLADLDRQAMQGLMSFKGLGDAALEAAAASIYYGDSFKEQLASAANSIGMQAFLKALFQSAEAIAFLAVGNVGSATAAAKAAAGYAATATAAKAIGAAAGGGGSTASAAPASASPIGSPQTFSAPTRESAQQGQQMVFNIQMGTVYSTERSALQALTSAITREINAERRGAPRLRRA